MWKEATAAITTLVGIHYTVPNCTPQVAYLNILKHTEYIPIKIIMITLVPYRR